MKTLTVAQKSNPMMIVVRHPESMTFGKGETLAEAISNCPFYKGSKYTKKFLNSLVVSFTDATKVGIDWNGGLMPTDGTYVTTAYPPGASSDGRLSDHVALNFPTKKTA